MEWEDVRVHKHPRKIPGTLTWTENNRRLVEERIANSKKRKSSTILNTDKVLEHIQNKINNAKSTSTTDAGIITFGQRRAIVDAYRQLAIEMSPTHFLTFMPGRFVRPKTIADNIIKFCCRLERKALGKNWTKFTEDRIRLIGFLEKPDITPHYHAIVFVPVMTQPYLKEVGADIWNTLVPAGSFKAQLIYKIRPVVRYATKDLHHYWSPENVMIYKPISSKK